uniref:Uncharacterized protein n=1 Tax=Quercus lobata TaxID=97700 RepID=A0A7N2LBM6_QUELO
MIEYDAPIQLVKPRERNTRFSLLSLLVAKDPSCKEINALAQHIQNLLTPSTPLFFNTLYDPYREGADFIRGYPLSLRGASTAISHGLWLNIPDYDAPTQLAVASFIGNDSLVLLE